MKFLVAFNLLWLAMAQALSPIPLQTKQRADQQFISIQEIEQKAGITGQWSTMSASWTWVSSSQQHLRVQSGMPVIGLDGKIVQLKSPPFQDHQGFWVPAQELIQILDSLGDRNLRWNSTQKTLEISDRSDLESIESWDLGNSGTHLQVKFNRDYIPTFSCKSKECRVIFPKYQSIAPKAPKTSKHIKDFQYGQDSKNSWLSFQFDQEVQNFKSKSNGRSHGWEITFNSPKPANVTTKIVPLQTETAVAKSTIKTEISIVPEPTIALNSAGLRDIVIDAGHGGKDGGALGAKSKEKDITLAIAKILRDKLQNKGFRVRMTRETDTLIELSDRPKMASKWKGDLFLSLHCNAAEGKLKETASGFKAYILRDAMSEEDNAIARRENTFLQSNGVSSKNELSDVDWIQQEHQLNMYAKESERFAKFLVTSLEGQKKIPKMATGAGQAGFMVLVDAFMPAVLLEMGFISHTKDEEILNSADGQEMIAEKISQSILNYHKDLLQR